MCLLIMSCIVSSNACCNQACYILFIVHLIEGQNVGMHFFENISEQQACSFS